ncbi:MAG TPA: UDP-N-acetylmuramoyl-L-alanine--D-glutamate ligase [Phycisphaerales bacterium]|nr:UDP-N-acetylmuramoyl-L-alanine--D-glutamate ligase [Phycisphaerales bacterium]|tara:strand:- start:4119 stop:5351 length:1233 start_codon:yes stop_codon:yes gene_type:complete
MNLAERHVVVMGLGRFGGGLGVTQWLLEQGAQVLLTDLLQEKELLPQLEQLGTHENLRFIFGEHREIDFEQADIVVANPAVRMPWENPYLCAAWNANVQVTTEIQLLLDRVDRKKVIGVTGSAGKSTTASMIHAALQASGKQSVLGGNIGGSMLQMLDQITDDTIVVLELSSAMLWWLGNVQGKEWSPHVGVLTNVSPNHLDWHGSMKSYETCKENIFTFQEDEDFEIRGDSVAPICEELFILGEHNKQNAAIALKAALAMGGDAQQAMNAIAEFRGLPHRLERIAENIYNDSKSTTPEACVLAVDSFDDPSKIHIIVGGYDKKIDLSLIAQQANRVAGLYAIGQTAESIIDDAKRANALNCRSLDVAVCEAKERMMDGDVLLLSPGCASLDQFDNYEQRGEAFCSFALG